MKKYTIRSLLTRTDEITEQRIAKQFPLTTDMENVFQRSLAKLGEDAEPANRSVSKKQLTMIRYLSAAACLILTIGLSVGVWAKRQKIEPLPPQETQTTTVTQTETRTETTAKVTTESQMTEKQTATTTKMPEPTDTLPEVIESHATVTQVSTMTEAGTTPERTLPATAAQSTAVTTVSQMKLVITTAPAYPMRRITDPYVPITLPSTFPTEPAVTTTISEVSDTGTTQLPLETYTKPMLTTETTAATAKNTEFPILSRYDISWDACEAGQWRITYTEVVTPSPEKAEVYETRSELFQADLKENADSDAELRYSIQCKDRVKYFWLYQYRRDTFSFLCPPDLALESSTINGNPCVWLFGQDAYTLYWDDGNYTFCIWGETADREKMLEIAECFVKKEE